MIISIIFLSFPFFKPLPCLQGLVPMCTCKSAQIKDGDSDLQSHLHNLNTQVLKPLQEYFGLS